ncbi:MAG: hypothetical protein KGZ85_16625 [Ignavibacterium sp.]|nr:hypothetical protein [Ignavibacterium sp.]
MKTIRFFLEDNQIISNINSIADIPIIIVQENNDLICPPDSSEKLHKHLPYSELILVEGGHLSSDLEIKQALLSVLSIP